MRMYLDLEGVGSSDVIECLLGTQIISELDVNDFGAVIACALNAISNNEWGILADIEALRDEKEGTLEYSLRSVSIAKSDTDEPARVLH